MVEKPISVEGEPSASGGDGLPPLEIDDTTPDDVLVKEAAWERGENIDDQPKEDDVAVGAGVVATDGVGAEEPKEPQSVAQANKPEETPKEPVESIDDKISRLVTEQTRGLQSTYDTRIAAAERAARIAQEQNDKFNLEASVETQLRQQERGLAREMGEEAAKQFVRSPENQEAIRSTFTQKAENSRLQLSVEQQTIQNRGQNMSGWLNKLQQDHGLSDEDVVALSRTVTKESLSTDESWIQTGEALGLMAERLKAAKTPSKKTLVPPETPETVPSDGRSTSDAPSDDNSLTASAQEKPLWAWTKEEHAAMRKSAMGGWG